MTQKTMQHNLQHRETKRAKHKESQNHESMIEKELLAVIILLLLGTRHITFIYQLNMYPDWLQCLTIN